MSASLTKASWGDANAALPDWREDEADDADPDDEVMAETPADVIEMLGFDPLDEEEHTESTRADDANWNESDHPRDNEGKFTEGGGGGGKVLSQADVPFAIKSLPAPKKFAAAAGIAAQKMVVMGLKNGQSAEHIAGALKTMAANYKHHAVSVYANAAIKHLEAANGMAPGSLGKAKPKGAAGISVTPQPNSPYKPATGPGSIKANLEALGPKPNALSTAQAAIYAIATDPTLPNGDKLQKIQQHTIGMPPGGFTVKFANEWTKALGGDVSEAEPELDIDEEGLDVDEEAQEHIAATAAEAEKLKKYEPPPAAPKPAPQPAKAAGVTQGATEKHSRGVKLFANAKKFGSTKSAGAAKVAPTLAPTFWKGVSYLARDSVSEYTNGAYGKFNTALRNMAEASPVTVAAINRIDELFEMDEARLTEDVVLKRGETVPADVLDKLEKELASGIPCRYKKEGFISTSMAEKEAFGGKNVSFEIVARKGTPALGVAPISNHKNENEVLLRHGQVFEVYEIKRTGGSAVVKMYSLI